jgi:small subunit ribosomal protein S16
MAVSLRLSRGGSKKRPYYKVVVSDTRSPRDGKYLEQVGTYNPLLAKDDENRVRLIEDRIKYWLGVGAQPTDRVARMLDKAGIKERAATNNPNKAEPGKKAKDRVEDKAGKAVAAAEAAEAAKVAEAEAAAAAAAAPPEEVPAEEPAEAPAEDTPVEAPMEEPSEAPAVEEPAEVPAEQPAEAPAEAAAEATVATPDSEAGDSAEAATGESAQDAAEG